MCSLNIISNKVCIKIKVCLINGANLNSEVNNKSFIKSHSQLSNNTMLNVDKPIQH